MYSSSHRRCSVRKGVLRNFAKFTGKQMCQGLFFNKVAGLRLQACNFMKKEALAIPVNFAKFPRTPFFTEHLQAAASECRVFVFSPRCFSLKSFLIKS